MSPITPGRIFISYRRDETDFPAGWLYERLVARFGRDQIFKDVDSIELGDDFAEVIANAVGTCDVLLALIGAQWLTITDEAGRRRLDSSDDFVRLEIEAALKRKVRVIPILVGRARMPRADQLPPSLAGLVRRQALELNPNRFEADTSRLVRAVERTLTEEETRRKAEEETRREAEERTRLKAEEETRRKAEEETRRKAEEETRREAEERTRREAEERTRREAEEDTRQKAEEETRQKAEEETRREAEETPRESDSTNDVAPFVTLSEQTSVKAAPTTSAEVVDTNTPSWDLQTPPAEQMAETPDKRTPMQHTAEERPPLGESTVLTTQVPSAPGRGRRRKGGVKVYIAIVLLFVIGLAGYVWIAHFRPQAGKPVQGAQPNSTRLTTTGSIRNLAFSPDGKTLAGNDGTVHLWNVISRRLTGKLDNRDSEYNMVSTVDAIAFSPKSATLATVSYGGIRLWDTNERRAIGKPMTGSNEIGDVAFSPDGKKLVSGGSDKTVRLWDVSRRRALGKPMTDHTDTVTTVAFSPDGKTIASGGDNTIRLWDVATGHAIGEPLTGHTDTVRSVNFHPNGKTLASGGDDRTIRLWDISTRRATGTPLTGHSSSVRSVDFRPDGKTLVSGSFDDAVRLWDTTSRHALGVLIGHTDDIWDVEFSPDGKTVASASDDKTILLWDVAGYGR